MTNDNQAMSYVEFDREIVRLLGRYLGGSYSAETLMRRFFRLHQKIATTHGGHGRPDDQHWIDSIGDATDLPSVVFGDLEDFAGDYTHGPSPENVASPPDPFEFAEPELRRRIQEVWIPQIEANYGPGFIPVEVPDQDYLNRRIALAAELIEIHRQYLDGLLTGGEYVDAVYGFRDRRDTEDVHHYQFDAAIWDAGMLDGAVIDADRDKFNYDGHGPARRRLDALLDAFPEPS